MATINNTSANINVAENSIIDSIFNYRRTDNKIPSLAVTLGRRFVKEAKGTKYEDSKGYIRFANDVRKAGKEMGVKVYGTSYIEIYEKDDDGNFITDEYGAPKKATLSGFLFETGKELDEALAVKAIEKFDKILNDGLAAGSYVLEEIKEKKEKAAKVTKSELEAENVRLKAKIAELEAENAALKAELGR